MDLMDNSAFLIAKKVKRGELSAQEVLEAALARIDAVDGRHGGLEGAMLSAEDQTKVHAFITLTEGRARQQAEAVDAKIKAGEPVGPLAGVPITIKDVFCVKDTLTTAASKFLANFTSPYTATSIERLEAAGAITLGKVNLDEFAYGSSTESSVFKPTTRNPWDPTRVPGGSSGGSAAAVAAGEGLLSMGSDTGGSIRQPAAFCGVVGLKPTYGRVSRYGVIAFASSLDCPGPLAKDVRGAALMLSVVAGRDHRDSTSSKRAVPDYLSNIDKGVKGMRVGLSPDYLRIMYPDMETGEMLMENLPAEIYEAMMRTADALAKSGAEIIENIPMPNTWLGIPAYLVISRVEASSNLHRFDGVKYGYRTPKQFNNLEDLYRQSRNEGFGFEPKLRILMGMHLSADKNGENYIQKAINARKLIRSDFNAAFDPSGSYRLDALLTPTTPTTAFKMGEIKGDSVLMQYADQLTVPANHAGLPALTIPSGLSSEGLPIGVQLIGHDFAEETLFQLGYAFEQITAEEAWRQKKPQVLREAGL